MASLSALMAFRRSSLGASGYVDRRLRTTGLITAREVEIVHARSHGWIDLLAFDPRSSTLVIVEIKTRLDAWSAVRRSAVERSAFEAARRSVSPDALRDVARRSRRRWGRSRDPSNWRTSNMAFPISASSMVVGCASRGRRAAGRGRRGSIRPAAGGLADSDAIRWSSVRPAISGLRRRRPPLDPHVTSGSTLRIEMDGNGRTYTVGELADLAHISVRTLHHYDAIGLLSPSERTASGYRLYRHDDLEQLQHILLYRELDFTLDAIGRLTLDPAFDRWATRVARREQAGSSVAGRSHRAGSRARGTAGCAGAARGRRDDRLGSPTRFVPRGSAARSRRSGGGSGR